ncbi:MAG TPA: hypothetical protein VNQ77_00195 [Frankiaceae bacterium]|nr:hypothetical protein [Frankiaceae bacterium]
MRITRSIRHFAAVAAATLAAAGATVLASPAPAAANHVATISVTQAGNDGSDVTLQVDVTYTGASGGGSFSWSTGDGRSSSVSDGVSGGTYLGDGSGTGTMWGGSGRLGTFTWQRTQPAANVARTRLTYSYRLAGVYTVDWSGCCPEVTGATPVSVATSLPACDDGLDNDGDGNTDYPDDAGCATADDETELPECPPSTVTFCLLPGKEVLEVVVRNVDVTLTGQEHTVVGWIERYEFGAGPTAVTLPCVRFAGTPNACAAAGGEFDGVIATLGPVSQREPELTYGEVIATAGVCEAELVLTVGGLGVDHAPALSMCDNGRVEQSL